LTKQIDMTLLKRNRKQTYKCTQPRYCKSFIHATEIREKKGIQIHKNHKIFN